ncbi:type I restriction enzyme HsdR N-terminal domain-containing protein [Roseivirga sp. BDSF3-8]|uniref:type I restriction enzyme HsdR N-terminal domain-containing protein n=1 Tax=Roseivirga sp. BDSF3-8 TaxID=3241598 RepID=UPI0035318D3B
MVKLNLPPYACRVERQAGKLVIFDPIRKKYLVLTPEEWVRQHFIAYLTNYLNYPQGLIRAEAGIKYNQMQRRSDIVVYDRSVSPLMLVECKAPEVKVSRKTFEQAAAYNKVLGAPYLIVTNGLSHFCCEIDHDKGTYDFIDAIPEYSEPVT